MADHLANKYLTPDHFKKVEAELLPLRPSEKPLKKDVPEYLRTVWVLTHVFRSIQFEDTDLVPEEKFRQRLPKEFRSVFYKCLSYEYEFDHDILVIREGWKVVSLPAPPVPAKKQKKRRK